MSDASAQAGGPGKAIKGVAWLLAFRVFDRLAGMVSFVILGRLLSPEHFGIIALATGVVALVEIMASLGLDTVLVQTKKLEPDHYDTAWTIQLGAAALCAAVVVALAWPAAISMKEPRLTGVLLALSAAVLIEGLQSVRMVDFRREMRFDMEFVFLAIRRTVTVVVTITAAVVLRNEWALAIGLVTSRVVGCVLSYVLKPYRPRLSLARKSEFLHKSVWLLLSSIVLFVRSRSADFVLGRLVGTASVGAYTLANDLATMASQELVVPINRVALSDLSSTQTDESAVARFEVITGVVAVIIAPLTLGVAACAPWLVPLLFGPQWISTIPILEVAAVGALIAALASNLGVPMISLGHYRFNAMIQAIGAVTLVPLLVFGVMWSGAVGAAWAVLVGNVITVWTALLFARRAFGYGVLRFLVCIWRPVVAAACMGMLVRASGHMAEAAWPGISPAVSLVGMVLVGAASYAAVGGLLWLLSGRPFGAEVRVARLLAAMAGKLRRKFAPAA